MISPYLHFENNCREALDYYATVFKTSVDQLITYGDMGLDPGETNDHLIAHATMQIAGQEVLFSDGGGAVTPGNRMSLSIMLDDMVMLQDFFATLAQEGTVGVPFGPAPWTPGYGHLTDKYGVRWYMSMAH